MAGKEQAQGDLALTEEGGAPARAVARGKVKRLPGRPKHAPTERRMRDLRVSVNFSERNRIRARAAEAGLPVAAFVRAAAMGEPITRIDIPAPAHETRAELSVIGRTLNQIARALNRGEEPQGDLAGELIALRALVDAVAMTLATGIPHTPQSDLAPPMRAGERTG